MTQMKNAKDAKNAKNITQITSFFYKIEKAGKGNICNVRHNF